MNRYSCLLLCCLLLPCNLPSAEPKKDADAPSREELAVIELVNAERKKADLPPLKANAKLTKAARNHSAHMAKLEQLDHELEGKTPKDRIVAVGYTFMRFGENIAYGQRTPAEVMKSWMESEPHKVNILRPEFTEIGVGMIATEKGTRYWTQVFGTPRGQK